MFRGTLRHQGQRVDVVPYMESVRMPAAAAIEVRNAYMCPTSNKLAFSRVHLWLSPTLRSEYWTGMEKPPKGTILPPFSTCRSCRAVRLRPPSLLEASSEDFLHCESGVAGFNSQAEACRNGLRIAIGLLGRLLRVQVVVKVPLEHVGVRTEVTLLKNAAVTFAPLILLKFIVFEGMAERGIVQIHTVANVVTLAKAEKSGEAFGEVGSRE